MSQAGFSAVRQLVSILADPVGGVDEELRELAHLRGVDVPLEAPAFVMQQNVGPELLDKAGMPAYPAIQVTCERVANELREKFRRFSGTVGLAIEIRVTHDRAEMLEQQLHACIDAVTAVLDRSRGEWKPGMIFSGAYEIVFAPAKRGGRNYVQTARVRLNVNTSM